MAAPPSALKRLLVGRPMSSGELEHTLLPKTIALPVFSSDALSSVAYATQEILLVLGTAGAAALARVTPISAAVATLLAIVVISYRQTVRAYPNGGGAYIVSRENLGMHAGLLAAAALLIDYVLTVSVSITAGVDAILSASPGLEGVKVEIALAFVLLVAVINLRGVKESGVFFAIPTYGFILAMGALLVTGFVGCVGGCPEAESARETLHPETALTLFVLLRAFAAGTTALTGVEAISNGVPAFRYPQSKNAATTLGIMGAISISMFLGTSWLAAHTHVVFTEDSERTVVAQIAHAVFGGGAMFYLVQVMTALILILAANTAFADFPRLASILAKDRFMPRQFMNRGDRLVFSNGIVILACLAGVLIAVFRADLNRLIQLYLVGVFISFTLSQAGMVVHWRGTHESGWRKSAAINAFGATLTLIVLGVVVATKFLHGAWLVLAAIPVMVVTMRSIHRHYADVAAELGHPERRPTDRRPANQHFVVFAAQVDAAVTRALAYVRSTSPADIRVATTDATVAGALRALVARDVEVDILPDGGSLVRRVERYVRSRRGHLLQDDFLTVVIPEILSSRGLFEVILHPRLHRLKAALRDEADVQVMDLPIVRDDVDPAEEQHREPARNHVCILASRVDNATLQAIEYAETLNATDVRAVTFALDPEESERVADAWLETEIPLPLEIHESPFRDIGSSLVDYIRQEFNPDGNSTVVTVILPEFLVRRQVHHLLHNQTALLVKRRLLFERGVVVVSVPFPL